MVLNRCQDFAAPELTLVIFFCATWMMTPASIELATRVYEADVFLSNDQRHEQK